MLTANLIDQIANFNGVEAIGLYYCSSTTLHGSKLYSKVFTMINETLNPDIVFAIKGSDSSVPNTDNTFDVGTSKHAHEICATLCQIDTDIFTTHDNGITFIAVGSDAKSETVIQLLEKCSTV